MFVRMKLNPSHYQLEGDTAGADLNERLGFICSRALELLDSHDLIVTKPRLRLSEFGDAMARYCINFESMKVIMALPPKAKISEIVSD